MEKLERLVTQFKAMYLLVLNCVSDDIINVYSPMFEDVSKQVDEIYNNIDLITEDEFLQSVIIIDKNMNLLCELIVKGLEPEIEG